MAETITLRAYLNDLNDMLERGAAAEVVSHCRYILQRFPQNVDTYRLLAQALLQRGHNEGVSTFFDESAEVFQRVLSVVPNDYVAHYGLSEIREQDGELDRAIWHMERAYEQLPGNQVLQDALRELYSKRDGEENAPTKIQLTRGALARQYVTGQLYDQALIELRNALQQDPSRVDLEVMLADTLWESQHPVEAGETAVRILKKLPNCLAANRILARLWLENERPVDAQRFLDRLEALDPYLAIDVLQPDTEVYDTITIDRLDYNAQAQAELSQETPDWVEELGGIDMGNVFSLDEPISSEESGLGEESPTISQIDSGWGAAGEPAAEMTSADVEVPDWFADIAGETEAAASSDTDEEDAAMPWDGDWPSSSDQPAPDEPTPLQDDSVAPAEIPDWFNESVGQDSESEPSPAGDSPPLEADWLFADDESPAVGESESSTDDFAAMSDAAEADQPDETAESDTAEPEDAADWLAGDEDDEEEDISDFAAMFDAAAEADQPDESAESDIAELEDPADWLAGDEDDEEEDISDFAAMFDAAAEADQPDEDDEEDMAGPADAADWFAGDEDDEEDITDFAAMFEAAVEADQSDESAESDTAEPADAADWLTDSHDEAALPSLFEEVDIEIGEESAEEETFTSFEELEATIDASPPDTGQPASGFTDLLAEVNETQEASRPLTEEVGDEENLIPPEWLASLEADATDEDQEVAVAKADEIDQEVSPAEIEEDDMSTWAATVSESSQSEADESDDWLRDISEADEAQVGEMEAESSAEFVSDEADDWLVPTEAGESFAASDDADQGVTLDWLQSSQKLGDEGLDSVIGDIADSAEPEEQLDTEDAMSLTEVETESETAETTDDVEDWSTRTGEWLRAMPDLELESVPEDVDEAASFDISEDDMLAADLSDHDVSDHVEEPSDQDDTQEDEQPAGMALSEQDVELALQDADELESETVQAIDAEESDALMPDQEEDTEDVFDTAYDPFEGGRADHVPEYEAATETGILQPDESPDWMLALTGELSPEMVDASEAGQGQVEQDEDDQESLMSVLGFEMDVEDETVSGEEPPESAADNVEDMESDETEDDEAEEEPFDLDQLAPPAEEEGAMPDWLAAITGTSQPSDEIDFGAVEVAEIAQMDSDLDWLPALDDTSDQTGETFDGDEVLAALDEIEETLGTSELDDSVPEEDRVDIDGIAAEISEFADESEAPAAEPLDDVFTEFDFGVADFSESAGAPHAVSEDDSADEFEFDFDSLPDITAEAEEVESEPEVAQLDELAHTKDAARQADASITFDFEDEASDTGKFSFDDMAPRWLRKPKDAFEDDETD